LKVPDAVGVPLMVSTLEAQEAVTPAGSPVGVPIPVAPVVVRVMLVSGVLIHNVGLEDAVPAVLGVGQAGRSAIMIPAMRRGFVFGVHVKPPAPVEPAVVRIPQAPPTATVLLTLLCPMSKISVKVGLVNVQEVKFAFVVEVILPLAPNAKIAAPAVTVVMLGKLLIVVLVAVVHAVGAVTSKVLVVLTPENATMAAAVRVEPEVTAKV
jgi:hypothetical protein